MRAILRAACCAVLASAAALASAQAPQGPAPDDVVARNAAARGGVESWRKLQTMAWTGHVDSAASPGRHVPFLLEQKRPDRTRFEVLTDGQRSIRMYDGNQGWKVRPAANGRPQLEPYSEDELRFARGAQIIDGPLMDFAAKGAVLRVAGLGEVDGRKAYVLDVQLPSGGNHRVWVDTETYLELRFDRQVSSTPGRPVLTTVFYRDYRSFEGVQIPTVIETVEPKGNGKNRLVIEKIALNPEIDDKAFARPELMPVRRNAVVVDTRAAATR